MAITRMLLALLLASSCQALAAQSQAAPAAQPMASAPFQQLRSTWAADLEAKRLASSVSHYTSGATFINPDGTHVIGSAAIRDLFTTVFRDLDAHIDFQPRTSARSGTLAYESGGYREVITTRATHTVMHLVGDYLTLYQLESDGQWRIVQQMWSAAPSK